MVVLPQVAGRKGLIVAVALVLTAALAVTGYLFRPSSSVPHMTWDQNNQFGIGVPGTGTPTWSFGAVSMCLDKPGKVTITSLTPLKAQGIKVVNVAVIGHWSTFGASHRSLATEGFPSSTVVVGTCKPNVNVMGSTFARTGAGIGSFESLKVNYTSQGQHLHLVIPWKLKLCPAGDKAASCAADK